MWDSYDDFSEFPRQWKALDNVAGTAVEIFPAGVRNRISHIVVNGTGSTERVEFLDASANIIFDAQIEITMTHVFPGWLTDTAGLSVRTNTPPASDLDVTVFYWGPN
jgi:hypothetical protein